LTQSIWPFCGRGVDSASSTNVYLEYFRRVKAAFLWQLSRILGALLSRKPQGLFRFVLRLFYLTYIFDY